jgi:RHS repeat-associated protein
MVYDGGGSDANTYADFDGSGNLLTRYLYAPAVDAILARTSSGGTSAWYLPDKLGTIRDIADTSGAVIDHVVYNSFGTVTSETNSANGDRFKFTGREYDSTTRLYYYRARYFDSLTGRFVSPDPISFAAGDADLFRYVTNNPQNQVDPSGRAGREVPAPAWVWGYAVEQGRRTERMAELSKEISRLKQANNAISRQMNQLKRRRADQTAQAKVADLRKQMRANLSQAAQYSQQLEALRKALAEDELLKLYYEERAVRGETWQFLRKFHDPLYPGDPLSPPSPEPPEPAVVVV